jgi:hypothetical protein
MLSALQVIAQPLDACWWYIGGQGFSLIKEFADRHQSQNWSEARLYEYWMQLLTDYVDRNTEFCQVGKPGFFSCLGDTVDFCWACYFAIEGSEMPLQSLKVVEDLGDVWDGPFDSLPSDVLLVVRDIDHSLQHYGFRDEWMFQVVLEDLRSRGLFAEEETSWPEDV